MGSIVDFDIEDIKSQYDLNVYVETGTGVGVSLKEALNHSFDRYYSVEIDTELYEAINKDITYENLKILNTDSVSGLDICLKLYIQKEDRCLFFLDAHFPEADFHKLSYDDSIKKYGIETAFPLKEEVYKICSTRNVENDIFIIDDLRIYEDGPFESGNWVERTKYNIGGLQFMDMLFKDTHQINRVYDNQGYMVLIPT